MTPTLLVKRYTLLTANFSLGPIERVVPSDADDDVVIASAVAAGAKLIVSGDSDLLVLNPFLGMRIRLPAEALQLITDDRLQ